jgi:hypothetical protein
VSAQVFWRMAPMIPRGMPMHSASTIAAKPSWMETGKLPPMISVTVRLAYLKEGPKSP